MPGPTPSQPGWYPDSNGTMRWYDGAAWTDHVQPGSAGAAEPTVVSGAPPEPTRPLGQHPEGPPGWQGGQPPPGPHTSPPPSPPSGQPLAPYGAVPQPSFPGGPGGPGGPGFQSSSGGGSKGLLIVLAVVGVVVLIAVLAVGAWAVFLRDGDGGGGGGGRDDSSLPDTPPEEVVEAFFEAARTGDCEAALELVSQDFIEENDASCDDEEDFMEAGEFDAEIGEATIDEEADPPTATVPVTLTIEGFGEDESPLGLVVEDGEWKIDSFDEVGDAGPDGTPASPEVSVPTGLPSEFPSFPTDPSDIESYLSEFSEYLTITP